MTNLPNDVEHLSWAAKRLDLGMSTTYRIAERGELPGAFKVGGQWRISVPRFLREIHGPAVDLQAVES
jgi:excisionase family DNA binding protein